MPELPEVETVARLIRPRIEGRRIEGVEVRWTRSLGGLAAAAFERGVVGARIARVWRRAKLVVLDLEAVAPSAAPYHHLPYHHLTVHLRMTGRLFVEPEGVDGGPYVRVSLALDDGHVLHFLDVRKFGRVRLVRGVAELERGLGPEPLGDAFTADWLHGALRARRRLLKPLLLDQAFVAGLGNIYVDEALHRSGLHPLRRSDELRRPAVERLHAEIRATLAEAIEREGSSFDTFYRTPEGRPGSYQHQFRVYGRHGRPCRACGRAIERLVVGQRGTHVCPRCQPRPRRRRSALPASRPAAAGDLGEPGLLE